MHPDNSIAAQTADALHNGSIRYVDSPILVALPNAHVIERTFVDLLSACSEKGREIMRVVCEQALEITLTRTWELTALMEALHAILGEVIQILEQNLDCLATTSQLRQDAELAKYELCFIAYSHHEPLIRAFVTDRAHADRGVDLFRTLMVSLEPQTRPPPSHTQRVRVRTTRPRRR